MNNAISMQIWQIWKQSLCVKYFENPTKRCLYYFWSPPACFLFLGQFLMNVRFNGALQPYVCWLQSKFYWAQGCLYPSKYAWVFPLQYCPDLQELQVLCHLHFLDQSILTIIGNFITNQSTTTYKHLWELFCRSHLSVPFATTTHMIHVQVLN